ncbi:54S ribosomal protein L7 [Magnaporthiopsis poae ATCC 64411]|uniref:54S ribosomal protein L7 n=1 Tax=Magnaporthiopsis poae (strain ATCC 64411 / 73-15) TaxID=644358 RepID=A0A0C4E8S6_MAGP6|nr:54S ribosomal protein L7 [Magnaporthiopsis poae ATCC 64411]
MSGLREMSRCIRQMAVPSLPRPAYQAGLRRCASTQAAAAAAPAEPAPAPAQVPSEFTDLELEASSMKAKFGEGVKLRPPKDRYFRRKQQLPGSRYQYHPPKYDRGPLHPIQSPKPSDPVARDFIPGPFNLPRLRQTYETTIASDLLTLTYMHKPPGTMEPAVNFQDLMFREWDDSSPYHKNRPKRGPRGSSVSRLVEPDINFNNVPEITEVTVASYSPEALKNEMYLWVARAMLQSISGQVPEVTKNRVGVAQWGVIKGKASGAKVTMRGNNAYEFIDKLVHIVFPRIKEWEGIPGSTGDSQGNISFGLRAQDMVHFPEMDSNISMYPPKLTPGCRIAIKTTAKSNRHARLLMQSLGMPFYGELAF